MDKSAQIERGTLVGSLRYAGLVSTVSAVALGGAFVLCPAVQADPVTPPSPSPQDSDTGIGCPLVCPSWKFSNDTDCVPPASFSQPMCLCTDIPGSPDDETAPC